MQLENFSSTAGGLIASNTFLLQLIKIWKTKSAQDLFMRILLFLILNVSLWLKYGLLKTDFPLIIPNSMVLTMILIMVNFKIKFRDCVIKL